jgi:hypothetical protein
MYPCTLRSHRAVLTSPQRRRSPTRTWASVSSTKQHATIATKMVRAAWAFPKRPEHLCAYLRRSLHHHNVGRGVGRLGNPGSCCRQRGVPYRLEQ